MIKQKGRIQFVRLMVVRVLRFVTWRFFRERNLIKWK